MPSWKKVIISGSNASLSGLTVTGNVVLNAAKIRTYENSLVSTGTNVIGSFPVTDGNGVNFEYLIKSNLNYRVGNMMAVWDGSSINFTEVTTVDIGNTFDVVLSCRILSSNVEIIADVVGPTTWVIKALAKIL